MRDTSLARGWDEVSIGMFADLSLIEASVTDAIDRNLQRLSVLSGRPVKYYERMDFKRLMKQIASIKYLDNVDAIPTEKLQPTFSIDGQVFRVMFKATELSAGQYITLKHVMRDIQGSPEERAQRIFQCLHEVMAVICVPCKKRLFGLWWSMGSYDGEKHVELATLFKEKMPMSVAYPIAVFFCRLWETLISNLLDYGVEMTKEMEKMMQKEVMRMDSAEAEASMRSSGGTTSSTK